MTGTFAEERLTTPPTDKARAVRAAIRDLPPDSHAEVLERLAEAVAEYEQTRNARQLLALAEGLLMTARLHRNPDYRKALADADEDDWTDTTDGRALVERLRAG